MTGGSGGALTFLRHNLYIDMLPIFVGFAGTGSQEGGGRKVAIILLGIACEAAKGRLFDLANNLHQAPQT